MNKFKSVTAITLLSTALLGCQSTATSNDTAAAESNVALPASYAQIPELKQRHNQWVKVFSTIKDFNLYSKTSVNKFIEAFNDADEIYLEIMEDPGEINEDYSIFSSGTYAEKYDEYITLAESHYNKLKHIKDVATKTLAPAIEQNDYLSSLKAQQYYATASKRVYSQFTKLFSYIEKDDHEQALLKQDKYLADAKKLEIDVTIKIFVEPLKQTLSAHSRKRFNIIAPTTYASAKADVNTVISVIEIDSRDMDSIEEAVAQATFELAHTEHVAKFVTQLSNIKEKKFEPIVLNYEAYLLEITQQINGEDYRNKPVSEQVNLILASLEDQKANAALKSDDQSSELTKAYQEIEKLNAEVESITNQKAAVLAQLEQEKQLSVRLTTLLDNATKMTTTKAAMSEQTMPAEQGLADQSASEQSLVEEGVEDASVMAEPTVEAIDAPSQEAVDIEAVSETKAPTEVVEPIVEKSAV